MALTTYVAASSSWTGFSPGVFVATRFERGRSGLDERALAGINMPAVDMAAVDMAAVHIDGINMDVINMDGVNMTHSWRLVRYGPAAAGQSVPACRRR
jgi:hypothetical protein